MIIDFSFSKFHQNQKTIEEAIKGTENFELNPYLITCDDIRKTLNYLEGAIILIDPENDDDRKERVEAVSNLRKIEKLFRLS